MSKTISPAQLEQFRRDAQRLKREHEIPLHEAQSRVAIQQGFRNWSLLAKSVTRGPAPKVRVVDTASDLGLDTRKRYYLHGDQTEHDPALYYCAQCDAFSPAEHFDAVHGPKTVERYLDNLRYWNSPERSQGDWRRPADAVNALDELMRTYLSAEAEREKSRSRFHRWIVTQTERKDWIGDLAGDIKGDKTFPVAETSLAKLVAYLEREGAVEGALSAMRAAYAEFSVNR
ncbi:YozE family protein [Burkholderia sp. 9120]|uniref:YozE family protein n=1 Tax=Burkholderia sp. 9120 TaxID=1500897 RepID=UPI0009E06683|nr:YozE family protein [Burkholderia sp. 9120]